MKYIIYNDLSYLWHRKKNYTLLLLFLIYILPAVIIYIYNQSSISSFEIALTCIGANFDVRNIEIISLLMFLFNVSSFIYLIIDVYVKDLNEYIENIFLRIKPISYIIKKNIAFMIGMFFVKLIQYIIIIGLTSLTKDVDILGMIKLIFTDYMYILLIQYLFFIIYLLYIFLKKNILILSILYFSLFILFPKNIWNTRNYSVQITLLLVTIHIFICLLFCKKTKILIENI